MSGEAKSTWIRGLAWPVLGVLATSIGASVLYLILCPPFVCEYPIENRASIEAQTIRASVELYLAQHPGDPRCPDIFDLVDEHMLNGTTNTEDPWGRPFAIDCGGEDPIVSSAGPDGVLGGADDILSSSQTELTD